MDNRKFRVIHTVSHSLDGLVLYDDEQKILFAGDTVYGPDYLITGLLLLVTDLEKVSPLQVGWSYSSHGEQLVEAMQHGLHLSIVKRLINGEGAEGITSFAGFEMPIYQLDGVSVTLAGENASLQSRLKPLANFLLSDARKKHIFISTNKFD
ncbi:MAG: MBL fold metallo-hydrolase [Oceanicoccus sp.]